MAEDAMNVDQYSPNKAQSLYTLTNGPLASSLSKLSGSSRGIPSNKDFYFYNNFDDFRAPIQEIDNKSQSLLESVGSSSSRMWNKHMPFPVDMDEAMDWLNNANDEIFERVDMSIDEFQRNRNSEEAAGKVMNASSSVVNDDDGFQLVCGKKKKGANQLPSGFQDSDSSIKVATKDKKTTVVSKPKIPFHIPSITRPQQEFNIFVNNNNQAFEHVWLDKSEDGKYVHPLKKFSFMDFVDKDSDVLHIEPVKPSPVETTPFTFVDEVIDLKNLAIKLSGVNEFAVDLEHNQYRSFQGLTCLIQISTRTEDFVIDALKLRTRIGPYLREAFKDPTKRKVMHGADRDIFWLQRDFGIYICNMFDTGQASRILKLERNSLEYLLHHFCGVTANKEYQNADWRLRPLPKEMLRYAREDTHYLLHIYDLMRMKLLSLSKESESSEISLQEVYKRSYELCIQLYEKEIQNENSYLYIYGLQEAGLNAQQLAVVSGLCGWRDLMARTEDESTGYILPNKTLIEIAKKMPETTSKLRQLVKSKHSFIEQKLGAVVNVVRSNKLKAPEFEAVAEQLKEGRAALASEENVVVDDLEASEIAIATVESTSDGTVMDNSPSTLLCNGNSGVLKEGLAVSGQREDRNTSTSLPVLPKASAVTVQAQKKPNRAFGALLGSKIPKKKTDLSKKDKEEATLEQIRASVHLPFHSFSSTFEQPKPVVEAPVATLEVPVSDHPANTLPVSSKLDDIIMLQTVNSDAEESKSDSGTTLKDTDNNPAVSSSKIDKEEEPMSLSDLSSSFKQCFQDRKTKQVERTQESGGGLKLEPFDYEAARKQVLFGENNTKEQRKSGAGNSKGKKKSDKSRASNNDEELGDFSQGRRRKAFPATGNRSSTFR